MGLVRWIPLLLLVHAGYSLMRWRKFLAAESIGSSFFIPADILVEAVLAFVIGLGVAISTSTTGYKPIRDTPNIQSYDSTFNQPNFKDITLSRAVVMRNAVVKRLEGLKIS